MPIKLILAVLAPFFQTAEQRQNAEQALRNAEAKFLEYTSGPLYQFYRVALMFAAAYDIILNGGAYGARTADTVGIPRAQFAIIELAVALWAFGKQILDTVAALGAFAKIAVVGKPATNGGNSPTNGTKPDRREGRDP